MTITLDPQKLIALKLKPEQIATHQSRLHAALTGQTQTTIPIVDACSIESGSIISWDHLLAQNETASELFETAVDQWVSQQVVSMIPAAGAASRFLGELAKFVQKIEEGTTFAEAPSPLLQTIPHHIDEMKFPDIKEEYHKLINQSFAQKKFGNLWAAAKAILNRYQGVPKAFVPTTREGDTFLKLKIEEQRAILPSKANVVVAPQGKSAEFSENLAQYTSPEESWQVIEQGPDLSTIRFDLQAKPVTEDNQYTVVAAGHGELVHLFPTIANQFPAATCIHIRNIDNVIGATSKRRQEMLALAQGFQRLQTAINLVRQSVDDLLLALNPNTIGGIHDRKLFDAIKFIASFVPSEAAQEAIADCLTKKEGFVGVSARSIFNTLGEVFHWQDADFETRSAIEQWQMLSQWLERPLSVMGVVRKEQGDVGGGPVIAKLSDGSETKLCMEMPHANDADTTTYFANNGRATHFNPVLVFFELRTHLGGKKVPGGKIVDNRRLYDDRFWLLSKKEYNGQPVCYHETVLYELIGNSATTNLVFIEVPRTLFNPHKTLLESLGRDRRSYGFTSNPS